MNPNSSFSDPSPAWSNRNSGVESVGNCNSSGAFNRTPVRLGPPSWKQPCVVESDHATRHYKTIPVVPIPLDSWLRVVSIDEKKVDLIMPVFCRIETEFLYPNDSSIGATLNRPVRRSPHGVNARS